MPINQIQVSPEGQVLSVEIEKCSRDCLLGDLSGGRWHRHGNDSRVVYDEGKTLILEISDSVHPPGHPLHLKRAAVKPDVRAKMIRRVVRLKPEGVSRAHAVCECCYRVDYIDGKPLVDTGDQPEWIRARRGTGLALAGGHAAARENRIGKECLLALCSGILELHRIGIAHGDPFITNVLVDSRGKVCWVDLGKIEPLGDHSRKRDIWALIMFSLLPALRCSSLAPSDVLRGLDSINLSMGEKILPKLIQVIQTAPEIDMTQSEPWPIGDIVSKFSSLAPEFHAAALVDYYWVSLFNKALFFRESLFNNAERVRHLLVEEAQAHAMERYRREMEGMRDDALKTSDARKNYIEQLEQTLDTTRKDLIAQREAYVKETSAARAYIDELLQQTVSLQRMLDGVSNDLSNTNICPTPTSPPSSTSDPTPFEPGKSE